MNSSPVPSRRANNLNQRSRSPSPAANSTSAAVHNNQQFPASQARSNFLSPDSSNLYRARRSVPDSGLKGEHMPLMEAAGPPLANPETDDVPDDREVVTAAYPGVDDGFFSNRANEDGLTIPEAGNGAPAGGGVDDADGRRVFPSRGTTPIPPMSPSGTDLNGFGRPRFPELEFGGVPTDLESIPDVNVYQHKKTLAQGMMDLALFSANANQLRYVVESNQHPYYYSGVVLISISLIFQVAVGVGLIWNSRYNVKDEKEICIANKINNFTIVGIFLVTVVNVFISAFGVASVQQVVAPVSNP